MKLNRAKKLLMLAVLSCGLPGVALAQEDATAAFRAGRAAFDAGQFDKAREQFQTASQTDPKNPEAFLWLGKAQYQLGQIDAAVTSWKRTSALAPEEPYSSQMLKALIGRTADSDTALSVISSMLADELWDPAVVAADRVLSDRALTDLQRVRATTAKAQGQLGVGRWADAIALSNELLLKYPALVDRDEVRTLIARAKLRAGGDRSAEGVAILREIAARNGNPPATIVAQYELLAFELEQGVEPARVAALAKWVTDHPDHDRAVAARRRLLDANLALAVLGGEPARDAKLSPADVAALDAAAKLLLRSGRADEALTVTNRIVGHLDEHYAKHGAYAAAKAGAEALLKNPLPTASRGVALRAQARYAMQLVLVDLQQQAAAGKLAGAPAVLPAGLTEVVGLLAAINQEPTGGRAWKEQAALAEQVRTLESQLPWPAKPTELKPPLAWALHIALPVVKANADTSAVATAVQTIATIVNAAATAEQPDPRGLALAVNTQLLAALSLDRAQWSDAAWRQVDLLDASSAGFFRQNVRDGKSADNAKLSQPQLDLIAMLARIVGVQASASSRAFERLDAHLQPWMAFGQFAPAEAAYGQLAAACPEAQRRQVDLALVGLWIRQAINEHSRLTTAGLIVPKELDPLLAKAAGRLYELQGALASDDPFLTQIRSADEAIINHYKQITYYDTAETAAKAKPVGPAAKPSPAGDTFAQFQLARLKEEAARRDLDAQLAKFGGTKAVALSDGMKTAIAAHAQFIADHPTDPLAGPSAAAIFSLGERFEQITAFDAAGQIYTDLAAFAAKRPALSQAAPGAVSLEERAAFAAVGALESKARTALATARAAEKGELKPPTKITDEYAAAVAAYEGFIKARTSSALVGPAIGRIVAIATDWARVDAWDVADGVLAVLLKPELKTRDPERILFARGMCQVGKVMPDHAREVLAALASGETPRPSAATSTTGLAYFGAPSEPGKGANAAGGKLEAAAGGMASPVVQPPASKPMGGARVPMTESPAKPAEVMPEDGRGRADREVLAAISSQEARRSTLVAQLREESSLKFDQKLKKGDYQSPDDKSKAAAAPPVLSDAEIARQATALDAAYLAFKDIRTRFPTSTTAAQARGEAFVLMGHWRANGQWQRSADMARTFLADNATDPQLPQIRLVIAQDMLTYAAMPIDPSRSGGNRQLALGETAKRFDAARTELGKIVTEFPDERQLRQDAQWQLATSFLTQAHTVGAYSPTLARGQYVRAVREMQRAAGEYYDHPRVATIPQVLWDISQELSSRGFHEEAISVWNDLSVRYPAHPLAQQAALRMAETYQSQLGRPLRAAEVYLEINFARGGSDISVQDAIYQIGSGLKAQSRWVESLHILQTFVASFPKHPHAGEALTMIGQIHQANEAWADAIDAYKRVTTEFSDNPQWVQEARWAIAECTINLSVWREAIGAYQSFAADYAKDPRIPEANRRTAVLKDLAKYQQLVDEKGPKAFDAQFQIATIVQAQLANQTKAIVEFRKVAQNWPASHLADDGLYQAGVAFLQLGRTEQARLALAEMAARYPDSPLADDALLAIGKSYEDEAQQVAGMTREQQVDVNKDVAQKEAYSRLNEGRAVQRGAQQAKIQELRQQGQGQKAELEEARGAAGNNLWDNANVRLAAEKAQQDVECVTASQLADRQDKINASLRKAVEAYTSAAKVPGADRAGEALLKMATIYGERLNDSRAAMATWLEIVRQFSGTAVAEQASWRIAQNYEKDQKYAEAIDAYRAFLRNYRGSVRAGDAQFAVAENYEHLGEWVKAMDSYGNYLNGFPQGTMVQKAKEQIQWIKTYRL